MSSEGQLDVINSPESEHEKHKKADIIMKLLGMDNYSKPLTNKEARAKFSKE